MLIIGKHWINYYPLLIPIVIDAINTEMYYAIDTDWYRQKKANFSNWRETRAMGKKTRNKHVYSFTNKDTKWVFILIYL